MRLHYIHLAVITIMNGYGIFNPHSLCSSSSSCSRPRPLLASTPWRWRCRRASCSTPSWCCHLPRPPARHPPLSFSPPSPRWRLTCRASCTCSICAACSTPRARPRASCRGTRRRCCFTIQPLTAHCPVEAPLARLARARWVELFRCDILPYVILWFAEQQSDYFINTIYEVPLSIFYFSMSFTSTLLILCNVPNFDTSKVHLSS